MGIKTGCLSVVNCNLQIFNCIFRCLQIAFFVEYNQTGYRQKCFLGIFTSKRAAPVMYTLR